MIVSIPVPAPTACTYPIASQWLPAPDNVPNSWRTDHLAHLTSRPALVSACTPTAITHARPITSQWIPTTNERPMGPVLSSITPQWSSPRPNIGCPSGLPPSFHLITTLRKPDVHHLYPSYITIWWPSIPASTSWSNNPTRCRIPAAIDTFTHTTTNDNHLVHPT